ncbi:hypothetical protein [Alkalicoccobacillus plakortidis]|uniref:Uncharacterized protein n=1 Tax=Alkalicoccobacillus plakortidis TaxID=444060 RepID=A0ABT0XEL6_9BACI|nr:hypothetical protein [Alkalicoccobacillus plakortidis]MCM2674250.1 hypothetical protein [Alkalicoccobacillus plakortidis]
MKLIAKFWPLFAFISIAIIIINFFTEIAYLDGVWYLLVATTYALIFLDIHVHSKSNLSGWWYILGAACIISLAVVGVMRFM